MRRGFTLGEILIVSTLVTSISITTYHAIRKGKESQCLNNLRQIYMAVNMFTMDHGCLPSAKFFPSSPSDPKGIHNILKPYGVRKNILFCPSLPRQLNKYGTNYIWNDNVNDKNPDSLPSSTWLMTEMTAVSKRIPPPHGRGFGILYIDGHAKIGERIQFPQITTTSEESTKPEPITSEEGKPFSLYFKIPSTVEAGKSVKISVYFIDKNGNYCVVKDGNLNIKVSDKNAQFPDMIDLSKNNEVSVSFNITFFKAGLQSVIVSHKLKEVEAKKSIQVLPGKAEKFLTIDFPESFIAGKLQKVKIISVDRWNNLSDYKEDCFLCDEKNLLKIKKITFDKGVWEEGIIFNKAMEENRILLYNKKGKIFSSPSFSIIPSQPEKILISTVPTATAGKSIDVEISIIDKYGNLCKDFEGELKMEISDAKSQFPEEIYFKKEDKGIKKVKITFYTSGKHKIKVYDENLKGEKEIYVSAGNLHHFSIEKIKTQMAGKPFAILIRAEDKWGNRVKGFELKDLTGSARYTQEDIASGMWLETIVIEKAKKENVIVIDDGSGHTGKSNIFEVKPNLPDKMIISGPYILRKNTEYKFQILMEDRYRNKIKKYNGEFEILCSDENAKVEMDKKNLSLQVKFKNGGIQTIRIIDRKNPSLESQIKVLVLEEGVKNENRSNK